MSAPAKVLTHASTRGMIASRLLSLAESMELPVQSVQSRWWGYEVPVELAQALADLADAELADLGKAVETPVMVAEDEIPAPTPKRGPGRPRKTPE